MEPGTNPGFLYQQNTLRDAQVAALTLDIFSATGDRLSMANLAQTVNVLQAMLLTEGDRTVKTPTYHVFDLYKAHQDAAQADVDVQCAQIGANGVTLPQLSASASVKDGLLTITCSNASPTDEMELDILLKDFDATGVRGRILSGSMDMYNDFTSAPAEVRPLEGLTLTGSPGQRSSARLCRGRDHAGMTPPCRCLLGDFPEGKELAELIADYVTSLPEEFRAAPEEISRRLNVCRDCAELFDGTCRLCGATWRPAPPRRGWAVRRCRRGGKRFRHPSSVPAKPDRQNLPLFFPVASPGGFPRRVLFCPSSRKKTLKTAPAAGIIRVAG